MTLASQADLFGADSPRPRTQTTRSGEEGRNRALDLLEARRTAYVMRARAVAEAIYARTGGQPISVDDIRAECPPPKGISGKVMGCLLRPKGGWYVCGETRSARGINHHKKIALFAKCEPTVARILSQPECVVEAFIRAEKAREA